MADANLVAEVSSALHEVLAPTTPPERRQALQQALQQERSREGAGACYLAVLAESSDEALLWFALAVHEAALLRAADTSGGTAERQQLRAVLLGMLFGPRYETLPPSARGKAVSLLARLVVATWPAEARPTPPPLRQSGLCAFPRRLPRQRRLLRSNACSATLPGPGLFLSRQDPTLLPSLLELLAAPGAARPRAAAVLAALADELAPGRPCRTAPRPLQDLS